MNEPSALPSLAAHEHTPRAARLRDRFDSAHPSIRAEAATPVPSSGEALNAAAPDDDTEAGLPTSSLREPDWEALQTTVRAHFDELACAWDCGGGVVGLALGNRHVRPSLTEHPLLSRTREEACTSSERASSVRCELVGRREGLALAWLSGGRALSGAQLRAWHRKLRHELGCPLVLGAAMADGALQLLTEGLGSTELLQSSLSWERVQRELLAHADRVASAEEVLLQLEEVLAREPRGRSFLRDFRWALERLAAAWTNVPSEPALRRELAMLTLMRWLFLAFVQSRGWLDGRTQFLREQLAGFGARGESLYRGFLCTLFFGVLNTAPSRRSPAARQLGAIPFLNGGLFAPAAVERLCTQADVPNAILLEIDERVFARYRFVADERNARDEQVLDPAMLGGVFEALMAGDDRRRSGSFYTPRPVVNRMLCDALVAFARSELERLRSDAGAHGDEAELPPNGRLRVLLQALFERGDASGLSAYWAAKLDARFERLRLLDPAAGSGAFLVAALDLLVDVRESLQTRAGLRADRAALRRRIATHNLFGVDRLGEAVRLCELRLWLSLSLEAGSDPVVPLPNLDLSVRQGDALLDADLLASIWPAPAPMLPLLEQLASLASRYAESHSDEKQRLVAELSRSEQALARELFQQDEALTQQRLDALARLAKAPSLLGGPRWVSDAERAREKELTARLQTLRSSLSALERDGSLPHFAFGLHFPTPAREGGFDLVVGNPPWIRPHALDAASKRRLRARYRVCRQAVWRAGARLGNGLKAGQVDLAAVFVERSLGLLRPGGVAALLVPSKLFTALSGGGLRRLLSESAQLLGVVDWSQSRKPLFDAATYPAALLFRRADGVAAAPPVSVERQLERGVERFHLMPRSVPFQPDDPESPWLLVPPESPLRCHRDTPLQLGQRFVLRRGVFTGNNDVFLPTAVLPSLQTGHCLARFANGSEQVLEERGLVAVLRGSDLAPYRALPRSHLLLTHDEQGDALGALPPGLAAHLAKHQSALAARADLRPGMAPWSVFRMHADLFGHKVVWRDIARQLEACFVARGNAERAILALNSAYYCAVSTPDEGFLLSAYLNSRAARQAAQALAEPARGGHARYFAWVVGLLPWPFEHCSLAVRQRLVALSRALHGEASGEASVDTLSADEQTLAVDELVAAALGEASEARDDVFALARSRAAREARR